MQPQPMPHKDVAPFLKSLRLMLDTEPREVLRWTADGRAFEIHDMESMMKSVLPKYFKHCKYTSFQRQLNYFNFRKWTKSKAVVCTFSNDFFLRDQPELAWRITRKKSSHSTSSSTTTQAMHLHHPHAQLHHPYARRPLHTPKRHETLAASPTMRTAVLVPPPFWKRAPMVGALDDPRQPRRPFAPAPVGFSPLTISAGPMPAHNAADSAEPLDWMIDCLLPPPDRTDDAPYGCYMYAPPAVSVASTSTSSVDPAKFEYVVM